jgi:Ca2+/Na+ antiporter
LLGGLILLFLLIFVYAFFRSSLHPPGHMRAYYFISLTGTLLFTFILLKCKVETKLKTLLLLFTTFVCLYAIEIVLSYYNPARPEHDRAKYVQDLGYPFDARSNYQVLVDYRNQGIKAFIYFNPTHHPDDLKDFTGKEIIPIGFISGVTSIHCNENGEYLIYKTDEHGFNNPREVYNQDHIDYVLIGDSFIKGSCVKREQNIAGHLMNKGYQVLNLGIGNTSILTQLATLKEYARPLEPKTVFWFFYEGNDHEGLELEKQSSIYLDYLYNDHFQDLFHKQGLIDKLQIEYHEKKYAEKNYQLNSIIDKEDEMTLNTEKTTFNISRMTLKLFQLRRRLGMFGIGQCECEVAPLLKDVFIEAKRIVDSWNGELVFVYLPEWSRYPEKINLCRKRFLTTGKSKVLSVIKDLNIPIIDIELVFSAHPDPLSLFPFRIYGHYNEKGYKLVADRLEKHILNNVTAPEPYKTK